MDEQEASGEENELRPLEILQLTMERLYLQGRLDEAARVALQMLAYVEPPMRAVAQRDPADAREEEASMFDLSRLSQTEIEWFRTLPFEFPEQERSAADDLQPLAVVQQAIRHHHLAGRLQKA